MNKGINLLGKKKQLVVTPSARRIKTLRAAAIGLLFGVAGLSIILFLLIALSPLPALQQQEKNLLFTLSKFHPDIAKLFLVEDRLKTSTTIIAKRSRFDEILGNVQKKMSGNISVTELTIEPKIFSVTVQSTSLANLDTFLNNLIDATKNKEDFSDVVLKDFFINQNDIYTMTVALTLI